ncbi:MAG: hypothetical protein OXG35_23385 [Acidobacteria bacterium]|nr:hypothetical protein [Acidobacteriota bacterium]
MPTGNVVHVASEPGRTVIVRRQRTAPMIVELRFGGSAAAELFVRLTPTEARSVAGLLLEKAEQTTQATSS